MGRPARAGVAARLRCEFRVTPAEDAALRQVARENGISVAVLIRDAVNEYVADYGDRAVFRPVEILRPS